MPLGPPKAGLLTTVKSFTFTALMFGLQYAVVGGGEAAASVHGWAPARSRWRIAAVGYVALLAVMLALHSVFKHTSCLRADTSSLSPAVWMSPDKSRPVEKGSTSGHHHHNKLLYVYDIPPSLAGAECSYCGVGAGRADPGYMTEHVAHQALRASSWTTREAHEARWFVVPLLYSCASVCHMRLGELQVGKWFRDERAAACATEEAGVAYVRRVFGWLSEQPAWRAAAHRHVFVWAQDKGAYRIAEHDPALFAELRRGVFVQVAGAFMPGRPLAFEPGWDVVIPPQSDRPIVPIPASAADARARQRTVFWQGAAAYAHSAYPARVAFVREYGAGQWPKVKLRTGQGGSASDRESGARGLTNATFCLFLSGHSPQRWSGSLGHMIASGCLLIFADDVSTLPLGETLPWESMSLQVPEATPAALSRLVEALSDAKLDEMLRQWRAVRPKLLFAPSARDGAVEQVVAALNRRDAPEYVAWSHEQRRRCMQVITTARLPPTGTWHGPMNNGAAASARSRAAATVSASTTMRLACPLSRRSHAVLGRAPAPMPRCPAPVTGRTRRTLAPFNRAIRALHRTLCKVKKPGGRLPQNS